MNIEELFQHVTELVNSDPDLASDFADRLYLGVADSFPAITIDGIVCINDKLGQYTFNINLVTKAVTRSFDESATYFAQVAKLKAAIEASEAIAGGDWMDRPETGYNRAFFPCQTWQ